jgi:tRNA(fMet)-specific endonuclease VapC
VNKTYMLDTCICSFIMREQPEAVLKRLEQAVLRGQRIVVSAITYSEMRFGATGPKASPRHVELVDAFCARLDAILPWIALRWTPPRRLRWRCEWPGRRSARTTRPLPGTPSPPVPCW